MLLQVAFIGALDPGDAGQVRRLGATSPSPTTSARSPPSPRRSGLGWLAVLLYVDAIVSPGDTGLIYTTITSRISFAMARNGNAPRGPGERTTDRGVPLVGLIAGLRRSG